MNPYNTQEGLPPASPGMYPPLQHAASGHFSPNASLGSPTAGGPVAYAPQPVPVGTPVSVMNPLQGAPVLASPVQLGPASPQHAPQLVQTPISMYKASVPSVSGPRVSFVKVLHVSGVHASGVLAAFAGAAAAGKGRFSCASAPPS